MHAFPTGQPARRVFLVAIMISTLAVSMHASTGFAAAEPMRTSAGTEIYQQDPPCVVNASTPTLAGDTVFAFGSVDCVSPNAVTGMEVCLQVRRFYGWETISCEAWEETRLNFEIVSARVERAV